MHPKIKATLKWRKRKTWSQPLSKEGKHDLKKENDQKDEDSL